MNKGNSPLVYCIWPEMGKQNIQALPNFQAFQVKVALQTPHFIANTYLLPYSFWSLLLPDKLRNFPFIIAPFLKTYFVKENPRG